MSVGAVVEEASLSQGKEKPWVEEGTGRAERGRASASLKGELVTEAVMGVSAPLLSEPCCLSLAWAILLDGRGMPPVFTPFH